MKDLKSITLKHDVFRELLIRELGATESERSEFFYELNDVLFLVSALNFKNGLWEHVIMTPMYRCPKYEEMCKLKDIFWNTDEIALQVHPPKSEYINIHPYALHLWRRNDITSSAEKSLKKRILTTYEEAKKFYNGKKQEVFIRDDDCKKLIIFAGNSWPTWEEVCKLKQQYWKPQEPAVQFNLSYSEDMNTEHIIILWDASDFDLPDKNLV